VPEAQLNFLKEEIAMAPALPTIVFSHVPILSASEFFGGWARLREGRWDLGSHRLTDNPRAVLDAVAGGSIKAFVSCHIHELERLSVANHHFICAGSVSGQMWNRPRTAGPLGTPEGFGVSYQVSQRANLGITSPALKRRAETYGFLGSRHKPRRPLGRLA